MIKRVMMCVICLILLSACDTGGDNSTNGTTNSLAGNNYVPIDLESSTEGTTGMIISGAIDHNTGEVNAFWIRLNPRIDSYRNIEVETRNGYLLRLTHSTVLNNGTYAINTSLDSPLSESDFAGGLLYLWSPDEAQQFTSNPQGTVTIRTQDEEIVGSFTMTVENSAGESINLEGQFYAEASASAADTN